MATTAMLSYVVLMSISLVITCLTYSPIDFRNLDLEPNPPSSWKCIETVVICVVIVLLLVVPNCIPASASAAGPLAATAMALLCLAGWKWQNSQCPNNAIAKLVATTYLGLRRQPILRRTLFLVLSLFSLAGYHFCTSFLLLDVLFMNPTLQNVLLAVTLPAEQLMLTTVVGILVMYDYAVIAFYFVRADYDDNCDTMINCTVSTIYNGMRADIGSMIEAVDVSSGSWHWYFRVVFDLSFFVIITTVLMNVISGIIIDTFGFLRDESSLRAVYNASTTFIACLDRGDINKAARQCGITSESGFQYIEKNRQHVWNYMNFIFYLKNKKETDFTGPETRIERLIVNEDTEWLPNGTCLFQQLLQQQPKG